MRGKDGDVSLPTQRKAEHGETSQRRAADGR